MAASTPPVRSTERAASVARAPERGRGRTRPRRGRTTWGNGRRPPGVPGGRRATYRSGLPVAGRDDDQAVGARSVEEADHRSGELRELVDELDGRLPLLLVALREVHGGGGDVLAL